MFIHHVYFWMPADATAADRAQLLAGIERLSTIDVVRTHHIGVPADTNRDVIERGYSFSWLAVFDSGADEAIYQTHPTHLQFVADCKHLWTRVVVYDSVDA